MVSQLQKVSTVDLYYICQMVDNVARNSMSYIRNIEEIFGDLQSKVLTNTYPKWTCFHIFIESIITSVVWEDYDKDFDADGKKLWVDALLNSNHYEFNFDSWPGKAKFGKSVEDYLLFLTDEDILPTLCEVVTKQVFFVLFANRKALRSFNKCVSGYLQGACDIYPDQFTTSGHLFRKKPPVWAKNAVFHRDKGRCVICKTDLTKYISQINQIHYDHIVPLASGGINCATNLQLTCSHCNSSKGATSSTTNNKYESWYDY